ncbi:MAG: fatty acid desaturase, partial [Bacteroidota bacterium]
MSITSNNLRVREVINQVVNDPAYKQVAHIPVVSIHQVGLIVLAYVLVFGGIALHLFVDCTLWLIYPMMIFGFYTAFTPFHDATHRAVSSSKWLNDLLGTISGGLLFPLSNTKGYRYLHLAHHRYVGDKDLDPDEPMVGIPTNYFPLGYFALVFPDLIWAHWILFKAWNRTPSQSRWIVMVMIVGNVLFHLLWFMSPLGLEYLILFFIPNRMAITYTAWAFAHTPHPEGLHWNDFPFQTTFSLEANEVYTWSLYGQEHHSMHHFLPHIPWYKYFKVWDLANGIFRKQNIPVKPIFSFPDKHYKDRILNEQVLLSLPVEVVAV